MIETNLTQNKIHVKLVSVKKLPEKLATKPFSTKEAMKLGVSKAAITRMFKAGVLERLSRGVYQLSEGSLGGGHSESEKNYIVATLRCSLPSAICLLSALAHYHVTDQIAGQIWVMVPASKRIVSKQLKLIRLRDSEWKIGIIKTKDYWITSLERTLIDSLVYKRFLGHQVALGALKQAISQKKVKLGNLYDMAKKMGVVHRIRPYIEAIGS